MYLCKDCSKECSICSSSFDLVRTKYSYGPCDKCSYLKDCVDCDHMFGKRNRIVEEGDLVSRVKYLEQALKFISTYKKDPPEIAYDEFAYKRLLTFVKGVAKKAIKGTLDLKE